MLKATFAHPGGAIIVIGDDTRGRKQAHWRRLKSDKKSEPKVGDTIRLAG